MAFPYTFFENFEDGTLGNFNSETDTGSALDFPHYTQLTRTNDPTPYRGAHMLRVDLANVGGNTAYVQENDGFDLALDATLYIMFTLFVTDDLTMAASDLFQLFSMQSTGPVDEACVFIFNNAGSIELHANETASTTGSISKALELGKWHTVELYVNLDAGGGNDGTLDCWLDGVQIGSQITALNQGAIVQARLGAMGTDAGTTAGRIFIDRIIADDERIRSMTRWANHRELVDNEYFFLGQGDLANIHILSTSGDEVVKVFNTDGKNETYTSGAINRTDPIIELGATSIKSTSGNFHFTRGCYVEMSGTSPRVRASWVETSERPGVRGPLTLSDAMIRNQVNLSK